MWLERRFLDTEVNVDNLVKGVQYYELFVGIALKNHVFLHLNCISSLYR